MSDLEAHLRSAPVARLGPADFGAWVEPHLVVMGRLAARLIFDRAALDWIGHDIDVVVIEPFVTRLGP